MIIHRPHRGGLNESMKEARQFISLGECINTLIREHNNSYSFQVSESDIYIIPYGLNGDDRIGWKDTFMICCAPYDSVKDQCGYELYYGKKYDHPMQLFGFISTDFK